MKSLKRKIFLIDCGFNLAMFGGIALLGLLNERYFETLFLLIVFFSLRNKFPTTFHCDRLLSCGFWTLVVFAIAIPHTLPITISLFSSIAIGCLVDFILYKIQVSVSTATELRKIKERTVWDMTEDELRRYGASKMLSEVQQDILVMRVLQHLKISEICEYRNYGRTTIKYHLAEIKRKLNIDKI